jgi:hypothetical protein
MRTKLHAITLAAAALMITASSVSHATLIQATYEISASGFQDSNQNPPGGQTSTAVNGTYTFTFDTEIPSQLAIVPDAVVGIDVVNELGTVVGFDESDSGVDAALNVALDLASITIGGTISGVPFMVGLSDDFRVRFEISLIDYEVDHVSDNFSFVTTEDPFYTGPTTVSLVSATVIPEPSTALLFASGLIGLAINERWRRA